MATFSQLLITCEHLWDQLGSFLRKCGVLVELVLAGCRRCRVGRVRVSNARPLTQSTPSTHPQCKVNARPTVKPIDLQHWGAAETDG